MRARFLFSPVIIAVVLSFLVGCTPIKPSGMIEPQPQVRTVGQPVAPPPSSPPAPPPSPSNAGTPDQPTNETIGFQIRHLLNTDPTTGAGIIVEVEDGNVTLRGTASTRAAAWRAEGVARSVKGVKSVVNQIIVNTPSPIQGRLGPGSVSHGAV
jgi:hypothetical protein